MAKAITFSVESSEQPPSPKALQAPHPEVLQQPAEALANRISALRAAQSAFAGHTAHGGLFQFFVGEQELYRVPLASGLSPQEATDQALALAHEKLSDWSAVTAEDILKHTDNGDGSFNVVLKDASKYKVTL